MQFSKKGIALIVGLLLLLLLMAPKVLETLRRTPRRRYLPATFKFPQQVRTQPISHPLKIQVPKGYSRQLLRYGDQHVRLDIYSPGGRQCPLAILLHGAAGIESPSRAQRYRRFATELMERGLIAVNVYYFDSPQRLWLTTITHAVTFSRRISHADGNNVSLIGYSLGGSLAMVAAAHDKRITKLAISAGYRPSNFSAADAKALPYTFFETGDQDSAMKTLRFLDQYGRHTDGSSFVFRITKGYGHSMPMDVFWKKWEMVRDFVASE